MKKLFGSLLAIACVSLVFTACNKTEPKFNTNLDTSSDYVGQLYGEGKIVKEEDDAQGIIFALSPDKTEAYIVAFTDIMGYADDVEASESRYFVYADPSTWGNPNVECGAVSADGRENTDIILSADNSYNAARKCRDYYKRNYTYYMTHEKYHDTVNEKWFYTKGTWYLPSMEELAALMKVKDRINNMYMAGEEKSDMPNKKHYIAIGGKLGYALWSSTEKGKKYAWYDLPDSHNDNAVPKTFGNEGGEGKIYIRPIKRVPLPVE